MKNKKIVVVLMVLMLVLSACGGKGGSFATVNGIEIPQSRFDSQLDFYKNMVAAQFELSSTIESSLIQEAVMTDDLNKNNVEIKADDYSEDYQKNIEKNGGPQAYAAFLTKIGVTDEQMKESLKYQTISRIHKSWFVENHMPTDEAIEAYFNQNKDALITVKASHILVKTEEEANQVKARLDGGEDFAKVAQEVSIDAGSAVNGGALGEASPKNYDKDFAAALTDMKDGDISAPVKTQFGYHIIKMEKNNNTLEALKDKIVEALTVGEYNAYLQDLMSKATIERPNMKTVAPSSSESTEASNSAESTTSEQASDAKESTSMEASESMEQTSQSQESSSMENSESAEQASSGN